MNRKMVKGIVLIVSLSLVCPLPTSAVKSQLPRHKSQVSPTSHKTGQLQDHHHHHQSAVASASAAASSLQQNDAGGGHQHQQQLGSGVVKETPLVRLKRIKRQVTSLRTIQPSSISSISSNSKYAVDHLARNPEKMEMRPIGVMNDGRTPATPLGSFHDFGVGGGVGGRVHTEMLRRLEEADRKLSQHSGGERGRGGGRGGGGGKGRSSGGKGFSSKTNEIADLRKGHHNIKDGSRLHLTGTGTESYAHHKHEQDKLDSTAAVVAAVRQRYNRKNKHQKNRSEFSVKGAKVKNYALAPRLRPGDRIQDSEVAVVSGRGRGRGGHADEKGHLAAEAKHRTRRGQHSGMVSTSSRNAGSHAEGVKTELERIRRMQRDLMKEISHLEHMKEKKKKKRRNVSERISQGQRKVAAPKRK